MNAATNSKMRILAVEDDDNERSVLKAFLAPFTSIFMGCQKLSEALELCRKNQFDCIILDLRLLDSDVDGTLASIRGIKELQPDCGMIVCSGAAVPDLKEKSLRAGADTFLEKTPSMFKENAKLLLITVCAAMLHHDGNGRTDSFMPHVRLLESIAKAS